MPAVILLAPLLAALLGALMVAGQGAIRALIRLIVPHWHIPGFSSLDDAVLGLFDSVAGAIEATLDPIIAPVWHMIQAIVDPIDSVFTSAVNFATSMLSYVEVLTSHYLPALRAAVVAYAARLYNDSIAFTRAEVAAVLAEVAKATTVAEAYAQRGINDSNTRIRALEGAVVAEVGHALTAAEAYAQRGINDSNTRIAAVENLAKQALAATATGAISTTITSIENTVNALAGQVAGVEKTIASVATTAVAGGIGVITTDVAGVAAAAWPDVIDAVDGAIDAAGTADADIVNALKAIPRAVPTDIAGVIAGTLDLSIAATRFLKDCGIPNCRNLSGIGNFLQDLLSDASLAALLAMLVEAIHDPEQAARDAISDLEGVINTGVSLAEDLVNV